MSKQDQNWKALIERYKASGLSQPDFASKTTYPTINFNTDGTYTIK